MTREHNQDGHGRALGREETLAIAMFAFDFLRQPWLEDTFQGEAQRYMPLLFFALYLFYRDGRLLTKKQLRFLTLVEHSSTTKKYVNLAEEMGFVTVSRSRVDKRKYFVVPTDKLIALMENELAGLAKFLKWGGDLLGLVPATADRDRAKEEASKVGWAMLIGRAALAGDWGRSAPAMIRVNDEAIRLMPTNMAVYRHRAEVLQFIGKEREALSNYRRALALTRDAAEKADLTGRIEKLEARAHEEKLGHQRASVKRATGRHAQRA